MIAMNKIEAAARLLLPQLRAEREAGLSTLDLRDYVGMVHHEVLNELRLAQLWLGHVRPPAHTPVDIEMVDVDDPSAWWVLLDHSLTTAATLAEYLLVLMRTGRLHPQQQRLISVSDLLDTVLLSVRASSAIPITTSILPPDMLLWGDALLLERALATALRNAILALEETATPNPQITLQAMRQNGTISLLLTDNGPGFPKALIDTMAAFTADAATVPQRFSTRSGGSGYGLPWLIKVVALHGGSVTLGNREDAAGAWIELRLPMAPEEQ